MVLPELTFPEVEFGENETPWNLNILLYKGGAAARANEVQQLILGGKLGPPLFERMDLVTCLHLEIRSALAGGGARATADVRILELRNLYKFADRTGYPVTLETITSTYCAWADFLVHRVLLKDRVRARKNAPESRTITMRTAYHSGAQVGTLLDRILERQTNIIELTRLHFPGHRKSAVGVQAEKQNLSDTFAFGHLLQDLCDALTVTEVLDTPLPLSIKLRDGRELLQRGTSRASATEDDPRLNQRYSLINLRIEAELLMFIGQTGMNNAQAHSSELQNFFYVSHLDGYQVKNHKARRGGAVLFEIFKDYKAHFERYLAWRRALFPRSNLLFPFIRTRGARPEEYSGHRLRVICKTLNVVHISPWSLRNTRVNWLLRKTADPNLTAEMAQHTKETLLEVYNRPSLQRAMVESVRFWAKINPHAARTQAVAPGGCTGSPKAISLIPDEAPKPDCTRASGCLWCEDHRDLDSQDYVWSLASFGHLKAIELSKGRVPERDDDWSPAQHAVHRIQQKLRWFEQSNEVRRDWVIEAQARLAEGDYHSDWRDPIMVLEGG